MQRALLTSSGARKTKLVCIDGNIGAGKSSVLDAIRTCCPHACIIEEPVKEWENSGILDAMYRGELPKGLFQITAQASRAYPLLGALMKGETLIITERSPFSDYHVFAKANLPDAGCNERKAYELAYDALMASLPPSVELHLILLDVSIPTLKMRISQRARGAENGPTGGCSIPDEYLERLHACQEDFFQTHPAASRVRINSNQSKPAVARAVIDTIAKITREADTTDPLTTYASVVKEPTVTLSTSPAFSMSKIQSMHSKQLKTSLMPM